MPARAACLVAAPRARALRPPRPFLTAVIRAPVHVELAPRRREAVTAPGRGRKGGREVCPGPGGRIVHVEVIEKGCAGRAGGATAARQLLDTLASLETGQDTTRRLGGREKGWTTA
jgi:hypothetical protein